MLGNINLPFAEKDMKLSGTKGGSFDHIGFEVKNLDAFAKKLEGLAIHWGVAPRQIPDSKTRVTFLTDPWGTYLEVTENFAPGVN